MAILNRTLDTSEQYKDISMGYGALATGATAVVAPVPWPCQMVVAQLAAFGTSGTPTVQLTVQRFIAGAGYTVFAVGSANVVPSFGTSGVLATGASLPAAGSTLLNLLANDQIGFTVAGTTSAVTALTVGIVLRPIQDVRKHFALA